MYSLKTQKERDQLDIEGIFIRIELLMRYGCLPYIMRHQNYQKSEYRELYIQIARWCNQPQFFKKKSFAEFCKANQDYAKTDRFCSSYQAYVDFKAERPDIADRYFDMRFEDMNATKVISSFGRASDTVPCMYCDHKGRWDQMMNLPQSSLVIEYYSNSIDQLCIFTRPNEPVSCQCTIADSRLGLLLYSAIKNASFADILKGIDKTEDVELLPAVIPQLNAYADAYTEVIDCIGTGEVIKTYDDVGKYCKKNQTDTYGSRTKYGECQVKILMFTDLVWKDRSGFQLTPLGKVFQSLPLDERKEIFDKLILKIPYIQYLMKLAGAGIQICLTERLMDVLKESTAKRRSSPLVNMLNELRGLDSALDARLDMIKR